MQNQDIETALDQFLAAGNRSDHTDDTTLIARAVKSGNRREGRKLLFFLGIASFWVVLASLLSTTMRSAHSSRANDKDPYL